MAGAGFEPAKAEPRRLQRLPFDRSGTPPGRPQDSDQPRAENRGRPASTSNSAYFGPPRTTPVPAATASAGMNHRRPSATTTKQAVAPRCAEALHEAAPALVSTSGAEHDFRSLIAVAGRGLDLDTLQRGSVVENQIAVRAMADAVEDPVALRAQPLHRRSSARSPCCRGDMRFIV